MEVRPVAGEEETAAIVAAIELLWPQPAVDSESGGEEGPPPWRFSGRWWARPLVLRRERPWAP